MTATAELDRRYRVRVAQIRQGVSKRVSALYGSIVTAEDIDAGFARFTPAAAAVVASGQSQAVLMATAYLTTQIVVEAGRVPRLPTGQALVGSTAAGVSLQQGMDALPAMVKGQIGKGAELSEALAYGKFAAERFADKEITNALDYHTDTVAKTSGEFSGWIGEVSPTACDPCGENAGFHPIDADLYRHGSCKCSRRFVVA